MAHGDRCLLVHGHFYQPPRENPWTGHIDPQYSAAPWENWNRRIADECYLPMARSRVYDGQGALRDLYNNYAHTSFNFGPTLLSWLETAHPRLVRHLADAAAIDRSVAMAQVYNHMMLPLADARDRHTQILWGLREFRHRFGSIPAGMWLSECGIDPETTRALIDHGVRFVILSPHQASSARPFGSSAWQDVAMGAVDTRRGYRLFETDGGGRTHFDRFLDVIFYTPGLNLKVSFDHILNRPEELARELERCYLPDYPGAQLVSIVTDGEIYGHHEKYGNEALARLFRDIAPALGLRVVSAGGFLCDHPPEWEVKLWPGEDGNGSSWSCGHGMGRWSRDCGCRPPTPPGWNQAWRAPLRQALDHLRHRVRQVARRELGRLVWDADDARNDYIGVLLDPASAARARFLRRHAQRTLDGAEMERLWRILEAQHNAMLMYSSCGWFFDELSGLEPVQNLRYALRAAELVQPWHDEDLVALLEEHLAQARSNLEYFGDGATVFRKLVLPTRHSNRELAAAMAVCLAAGFPVDSLAWRVVEETHSRREDGGGPGDITWGSFVCHDPRLDRFIKTAWLVRLDDADNSAVGLHAYEEVQGDPFRGTEEPPLKADPDFAWVRTIEAELRGLSRPELVARFGEFGVSHQRLPEAVRTMLYLKCSAEREREFLAETARLGARAVPFLTRARRHGARVPDSILASVTGAFELEMTQAVHAAIAGMRFDDGAATAFEVPRASARELGLAPDGQPIARALLLTGMELFHWLSRPLDREALAALSTIRLADGGEWLAPAAPATAGGRFPAAGDFATALGIGLARLRSLLLAAEEPGAAALALFPLPELLSYARRLDLDIVAPPQLAIEYWDFLDTALAGLVRTDPVGILTGEAGDRVRRTGHLLGFSDAALDKRLGEVLRRA
ncbi:MAG: DUF3536 domain-containing protein [Planctomycetes bacterium]|nr:DUF3536 domain-containing protein [Planctomycetota bacterium]